jgi:regulator of protease activity HflC (stomatin/prohibitin superfamily)
MAEQLRSYIQTELSGLHCGLDMVAVVIEAIHPPAGAADAYHAVRAAEIAAQSAIAGERGSAIVVRAQAKQYEDGMVSTAQASASETVETARILAVRFASDLVASKRGSKVFALERYFSVLDKALSKTPKTILDHRLSTPGTATLDLRPLSSAPPSTGSGD